MGTRELPRVALVGVHGWGEVHRENLSRLTRAGRVAFVAAVDSTTPDVGTLPPGVAFYSSLDDLLAGTERIDIVILATPIHTHAPLAGKALDAGAHVYLEKPPFASVADYRSIEWSADRAGCAVQVGFQSLGSHVMSAAAELMAGGELGAVESISATGLWTRPRTYFTRSRWAGRRTLDGVDVIDGVVTNPLAHAVQTALWLAGSLGADDIGAVDTDLYHANPIDSDDTSVIRVHGAGVPITCAFTLCAEVGRDPFVTIAGTHGHADLHYTRDALTVHGRPEETFGRDDLLENLIDHIESSTPLLSPLSGTGAFMQVVDAVRAAPAPTRIDPVYFRTLPDARWGSDEPDERIAVTGIDALVTRAAKSGATFAEVGAAWARP